ncbi:MAG: methyltransferase domain-containing protein [Bacteroidales bacterium]|nr:methyltransferase domain-containing protein [Bacteroidales bacterium]
MTSIPRLIASYFLPQVIDTAYSEVSGKLEVSLFAGRLQLDSPQANYSFGGLHKAFRKFFGKVSWPCRDFRDVLILGYGAGSVASILRNEQGCTGRITGVEMDREVVRLAGKYFPSGVAAADRIVVADAYNFMDQNRELFDLIVIDLYVDDRVPPVFEGRDFLEHIRRGLLPEGHAVFNKAMPKTGGEREANTLLANFELVFGRARMVPVRLAWKHCMIIVEPD